jgi:hypothetical protein
VCAANLVKRACAARALMLRPAVQRTIAIESAIGYELPD